MNIYKEYEKIFSRDFSLVWLQLWYIGEAKTPKPWNNQINKSFPYIVFVRRNNTVEAYYDKRGLNWSRKFVLNEARKDKKFLDLIQQNVKEKLKPIKNILKEPYLRKKDDLLHLLDLFQNVYPWLYTMWEICDSEEKEIGLLDVTSIKKLKETTNTISDDLDNIIRKSLEKIFPLIADYIHVLTLQEIKSGTLPKIAILNKRDMGFIYTDSKLFDIIKLAETEKKYNLKLKEYTVSKSISIIKGNSASIGHAKGLVRRIMGYKDIFSFKTGEILVSPMTVPNFLPAIKKAAAIVTDEGGITCHASILARELNKPCVVGTKIATIVLNNGDLVDVDANTGIIKVVSRNSVC